MKWEYLVVEIFDVRQNNEIRFGEFGALGWELVAIESNTAYFKRLKISEKQEKQYSYDTVQDGYVIYEDGIKIDPWNLARKLND